MTMLQDTGARHGARPSATGDFMSRTLWAICGIAIVVGVAAAVHFSLMRGSLWEDELIAITHANQPLPLFFIEVLRNDLHPPLYFLQLAGWQGLGFHTDAWVLANSLAWAAVSLGAMFFVAHKLHGIRAAWIATALFAVLPNFVWSAGTLRMYAALPACVLFAYYANRRWFDTRSPVWLAAAVIVEVLLAYTHAVEFFFVAFIVFGALVEAGAAGRLRLPSVRLAGSMRMWVIAQIVFGACVLPLAASALVRSSDASAPGSTIAMLTIGGGLVAGWKTSGLAWARMGGFAIFVLLLGAALSAHAGRWRTLAIPVAALVVAMMIAIVFKPMFKQPVFAANLLPFLVLGAAAAAGQSRPALVVVAGCIAVLAAAAFPLASRQAQLEPYAPAARWVRERAVAGDVVVVPNVSVFWGIARYAIGPRWGRPLAIMPPPNDDWTRLNERIARTLGPDAPKKLGLVPDSDFVDSQGVRYVIGDDAIVRTSDARHVWLVTRDRYKGDVKVDPRLHPSEIVNPETFGDGELLVRRLDRSDTP
ncbi:MAG: hypothetical protein ABI277_05105 [Burkholderiaceae bacterium]